MTVITFGKHKGSSVEDVPINYLVWGSEKLESPKWRKVFNDELSRRARQEEQEKLEMIANLDSPEVMEKLIRKYIIELEIERDESGCEWEYDRLNFYEMAKDKAMIEVASLRVDKLKYDYQNIIGTTADKLELIERIYDDGEIAQVKFSSPEKRRLAMEYLQKREELIKQWIICEKDMRW